MDEVGLDKVEDGEKETTINFEVEEKNNCTVPNCQTCDVKRCDTCLKGYYLARIL
jgi:hypothetical protein